MKDTVYFPVMVVQPYFQGNHFSPLLNQIRKFDTPDGIQITKVEGVEDALVENLLLWLQDINRPSDEVDSIVWNSPECLFCVDFESDKQVHFEELVWFEEQMIRAVKDMYQTVGVFYFYHINNGSEFKYRNAAKVEQADGTRIVLDVFDDNLSFFLEAAPFLAHAWYGDKSIRLRDVFPAEAAKYHLLFGEHL